MTARRAARNGRGSAIRGSAILAGVLVVLLFAAGSASGDPQPPAPMSPSLAEQMALAEADEPLRLMVHGTDLAAAEEAVAATGMSRLGALDRIGVVVACATPAQVEAARTEPGVVYLEGERQLRSDTADAAGSAPGCRSAGC